MTLDKDLVGIFFSSLCMLHCLAGPIILAMGITSMGFSFLLDEKIHLALVFPIILFAIWSIPNGFKIHQKILPLIVAIVGILLLLLGLFIEELEMMLTFSASSFLIFAHFANKKFLRHV